MTFTMNAFISIQSTTGVHVSRQHHFIAKGLNVVERSRNSVHSTVLLSTLL